MPLAPTAEPSGVHSATALSYQYSSIRAESLLLALYPSGI